MPMFQPTLAPSASGVGQFASWGQAQPQIQGQAQAPGSALSAALAPGAPAAPAPGPGAATSTASTGPMAGLDPAQQRTLSMYKVNQRLGSTGNMGALGQALTAEESPAQRAQAPLSPAQVAAANKQVFAAMSPGPFAGYSGSY